jgi:hypothetical protein
VLFPYVFPPKKEIRSRLACGGTKPDFNALKTKNPLGSLTPPRGHTIARVSVRNLYAPDFFNFQTTTKIYQLKKYLSRKSYENLINP